jgi:hypothetical protein
MSMDPLFSRAFEEISLIARDLEAHPERVSEIVSRTQNAGRILLSTALDSAAANEMMSPDYARVRHQISDLLGSLSVDARIGSTAKSVLVSLKSEWDAIPESVLKIILRPQIGGQTELSLHIPAQRRGLFLDSSFRSPYREKQTEVYEKPISL